MRFGRVEASARTGMPRSPVRLLLQHKSSGPDSDHAGKCPSRVANKQRAGNITQEIPFAGGALSKWMARVLQPVPSVSLKVGLVSSEITVPAGAAVQSKSELDTISSADFDSSAWRAFRWRDKCL